MLQLTNLLEDYKLICQYPYQFSQEQKSQFEDSVLLRVAGLAAAFFALTISLFGLSMISYNFLEATIALIIGSAAGVVAHDLICWGENLREIVLQQELFANGDFFENIAHVAKGINVLFSEVATGYPYELHNTLVFKYVWKLQNPAVL